MIFMYQNTFIIIVEAGALITAQRAEAAGIGKQKRLQATNLMNFTSVTDRVYTRVRSKTSVKLWFKNLPRRRCSKYLKKQLTLL